MINFTACPQSSQLDALVESPCHAADGDFLLDIQATFFVCNAKGTSGNYNQQLTFGDMPGIVAWCQSSIGVAAILAGIANGTFGWNTNTNSVDFSENLGPVSGEDALNYGSGGGGSGWTTEFMIYTDQFWNQAGQPNIPHGVAGAEASPFEFSMSLFNISIGQKFYVPTAIYFPSTIGEISQRVWGQYAMAVPPTTQAATGKYLLPMPNFDTSVFSISGLQIPRNNPQNPNYFSEFMPSGLVNQIVFM